MCLWKCNGFIITVVASEFLGTVKLPEFKETNIKVKKFF